MPDLHEFLNHNFYNDGIDDIPYGTGDRYHCVDLLRDFRYLESRVGEVLKNWIGGSTGLLLYRAGDVTEVDKTHVLIPECSGIAQYAVDVPDDSIAWALPKTKTSKTVQVPVYCAGVSSQSLAGATYDGVTVNYIKLRRSEANVQTRARHFASGTYNYCIRDYFMIVVGAAAPALTDIVIATFVGNGTSTLTITQRYPISKKRELFSVNTSTTFSAFETDSVVYSIPTGDIAHDISAGAVRSGTRTTMFNKSAGSFNITLTYATAKTVVLAPGDWIEAEWMGTAWVFTGGQFVETPTGDTTYDAFMTDRNIYPTKGTAIAIDIKAGAVNKRCKCLVKDMGAGTCTLTIATGKTITLLTGEWVVLEWDGTAWWIIADDFSTDKIFAYTSTGANTHTVPAGRKTCRVIVTGAGGGGYNIVGAERWAAAGGTAIKRVSGLSPGDTITATVGAGGAVGDPGGNGGTSSFGAHCSATGGTGGQDDTCPGGVGTGGDINITGGYGGLYSKGASFWGGGSGYSLTGAFGGAGQSVTSICSAGADGVVVVMYGDALI